MQVTLNMLLAAIRDFPLENRVPDTDERRFSGVALLCALPEGALPPPERLLVGTPGELSRAEGGVCVCVCAPEEAAPETQSPLILLRTGCSPLTVYERLSERFLRIMDWRLQMVEAMNRGCSLQELMEMSKDMLGNYIAVNDSAFRLIANTANIPCDDDICQRMIEHGYHPESVVAKFRSTGRVKFWEKHDFYIDNGQLFSPYTLVGRIFRINGQYAAHAVMTCNNFEATPDVVDLYNMLCDFIAQFAARDWENQNAELLRFSSLLTDLLSGVGSDYAAVEERLRQSGFPAQCSYYLLRIPISTVADTLVGRLSKDLFEVFPHVHVTLFQQELVLLAGMETASLSPDVTGEITRRAFQLFDRYELCCGVSTLFHELSAFPLACRQAGQALASGERLRRAARIAPPRTRHPRVFTYDELLPYCLLHKPYEEIQQWRTGAAGQAIAQLVELDRRHGSNNLELLYTYLMNERRAKETGEALHLHRNSVVYRIEHLRSVVPLGDLENPEIRAGLLMSLRMYNLYGLDE